MPKTKTKISGSVDRHVADLNDQIAAIEARSSRLLDEAEPLNALARSTDGDLTDGQVQRLVDIERAIDKNEDQVRELRRKVLEAQIARTGSAPGSPGLEGGDFADTVNMLRGRSLTSDELWRNTELNRLGPDDLVDTARRAIDRSSRIESPEIPDHAYERAEALVTSTDRPEALRAANWAIAASDPAYSTAFGKLLANPTQGHLEWNEAERSAYTRVSEVSRSLGLTTQGGSAMVPLTLDPAIMLTNDGSINPMRRLARVEQTMTNTWNGVTSSGVTASWYAENAEVTDDTPTTAPAPIPVHRASAFAEFSFELEQDTADLLGQLRILLVDAADQLQAEAHVAGTGSDQPTGFVSALAGGSSIVDAVTAETFSVDDVYRLLEALPPRFRANAAWVAALSTLNTLDQFTTGDGNKVFPAIEQNQLLRRPIEETSNMAGTAGIDSAADADSHVLGVGDWRAGMVIADRVGATIELIPHMLGANGRPTGQRGALLWFRTGADVVAPNAIRLLNVATAA